MRQLWNEIQLFGLQGGQLVRGSVRTAQDWVVLLLALACIGPLGAGISRIVLGKAGEPDLAGGVGLAFAALPFVTGALMLLFSGKVAIAAAPEIVEAFGAGNAAKALANLRSWIVFVWGGALMLAVGFAKIPIEHAPGWTVTILLLVTGSAMWNSRPHRIEVHWWVKAIAFGVVVMLMLGGPQEAPAKIGGGIDKLENAGRSFVGMQSPTPERLVIDEDGQSPSLPGGDWTLDIAPGTMSGCMAPEHTEWQLNAWSDYLGENLILVFACDVGQGVQVSGAQVDTRARYTLAVWNFSSEVQTVTGWTWK